MVVCTVIYTKRKEQPGKAALPILLMVSWTGKMDIPLSPFTPKNLVSRDGFGSSVSRQPVHLHTQAESGVYLRDSSRVPRRRPFFFFFFFFISLIADGPHHYHPACGHKGSSHLSPVHALQFFIAMQVQHSYNSSTNGWILLTHVPTLSVTKERTQILLW